MGGPFYSPNVWFFYPSHIIKPVQTYFKNL